MSDYEVRIGDTFVNLTGTVVTLSGSLRFNVSEGDEEILTGVVRAIENATTNAMVAAGGDAA